MNSKDAKKIGAGIDLVTVWDLDAEQEFSDLLPAMGSFEVVAHRNVAPYRINLVLNSTEDDFSESEPTTAL